MKLTKNFKNQFWYFIIRERERERERERVRVSITLKLELYIIATNSALFS